MQIYFKIICKKFEFFCRWSSSVLGVLLSATKKFELFTMFALSSSTQGRATIPVEI
jgi:hypothetical protein